MDKEIRNKLRNVVTNCRKLLEESIGEQLQGHFGIHADGKIEDESNLTLSEEDIQYRHDILDHFEHIKALGYKAKDSLAQLIREIAFTHLNRFCAYKMMAARDVVIGSKKFRDPIGSGNKTGPKSNAFMFYLADHPDEEKLANSGKQDRAYRHFLDWVGEQLSEEIGVLFNSNDPANRLYPPQRVLDEIFDLLNKADIKEDETELKDQWPKIWAEDETVGWVYQYFIPKELRDQARKESSSPRNSYELAFRNQFFTPRYVVEFLTDNTLGRIWYEMRKGETRLADECEYMLRRPNEVFLQDGEQPPESNNEEDLSQQDLLKLPVHIPHRAKKDPREIRILDPACGSGHFLLYCFNLLVTIYDEAYDDSELSILLTREFPSKADFKKAIPGLILANNLHGVDIDLRATQIAALALWLRCQRMFSSLGVQDRPEITRSNFVCAEPMPENAKLTADFVAQLEPKLLGQLVSTVFERMRLAGEAGSLLKIEDDIGEAIRKAKAQWTKETSAATDNEGRKLLFSEAEMDRITATPTPKGLFDVADIEDAAFWDEVESKVVDSLRAYSDAAGGGHRTKLFTHNAERGFAFIDTCRKRFDVVLMNPPFGEVSTKSRDYLYSNYDNASQDIFSAFVDRGISMLAEGGFVGAITSRLAFFLELLSSWRSRIFGGESSMTAMADLGYGVLDEALVEAAAYVISRQPGGKDAVFINLLADDDKASSLLSCCNSPHDNRIHHVATSSFFGVPSGRAAYWVSEHWRKLFAAQSTIQSKFGFPYVGLQTGNDDLFLRLHWEVPDEELQGNSPRWISFAKGGEYATFYGDYHLVIDWSIHDTARRQSNADAYFKSGVTYTERTTSNLSARVLPSGCVFSPNGVTISVCPERLLECLFFLNTRAVQFLIEMCVGSGDAVHSGSAARHYGPRIIAKLPVPDFSRSESEHLAAAAHRVWELQRGFAKALEPDRHFVSPLENCKFAGGPIEAAALERQTWEDSALAIIEATADGEAVVHAQLGVGESVREELEADLGRHPSDFPKNELSEEEAGKILQDFEKSIEAVIDEHVSLNGASRALTKKAYYADRRLELLSSMYQVHPSEIIKVRRANNFTFEADTLDFCQRLVSYAVGVAFGRWDIRFAVNGLTPELPGLLEPLPPINPGRLVIPASADYPVRFDEDGILVDDSRHTDDIVRATELCIETIWPEAHEQAMAELVSTLPTGDLRTFFRRTTTGGFWNDHLRRYSKSRRKSPIYLLLQSKNKNYALWLYYLSLNADTLFKAIKNYVDPRINLAAEAVKTTRHQIESSSRNGSSTTAIRRLEQQVEAEEELLTEIVSFREELQAVADLNLVPDLNDGSLLNLAPLHRLSPWPEAKKRWGQLLVGKYEWSSIGQQLRAKGLVKD